MGERAVHGLSESFEKINNDGMKLDDETKTRKIKMRSFDLNVNEPSKMKPLCKTKSLSSHFVVNLDELNVQSSLRSNEETELLSIYESSSPSIKTDSDHPMRLTKSRSDADDEGESDSCRWKVEMEPAFGISLKFEDVHYSVRMKGSESSSAVEKCILKEVSGSVHPGEVLALMGPSGGGKTTLLNLLSGRVRSNGGIITYNDRLYTKSLKRRIGFVMQDDTVFPHLTVKETLTYSALLRLPNTLSEQQKKDRAMDVLSQLGLERCQNTMVGGDFVRGVSGGERKRVCIGNEVLLNPSLLFLDEPTSGLDSTTALHIIQMLKDIAQAGRTVVTTIHQPSSRKFSKFDKLILLSSGSSLYFGKASEAMEYFSSLGCFPLIAMNPAEFLVDLACGNMKEKSVPSELEHTGISPGEVHKYLLGAYESRTSKMEKVKLDNLTMFEDKFEKQNMCDAVECGASWSAQFCILFKRGLKERRHEYFSSVRVIQVVSTSVIAGLIWWKPDASSASMAQDQAGLLFFISVYWAFFPVFTAIHTFPLERAMLAKERSVDMYKLSAYLLARNASDLPLDLTLPVIFLMIIYFMVGLKPTFSAFSSTLLSIFLSIIAAQGLGLAIGAAVMDMKKATALASVAVMTAMLAGGFFINKVPPFMSWIRNVSLNYHTYKLLLKIQCSCNGKDSGSEICSLAFVKAGELDHGGTEVGAMVVMIVGYRLLTYISLRRMKLRAKA